MKSENKIAYYHFPGLFEFYDFYKVFLPLYKNFPEYFYDWCKIGSIYGSPADCLWGGGRVGFGNNNPKAVADLMNKYEISSRLTFSNSLLTKNHLSDKKCNNLCTLFHKNNSVQNGVVIYSDLLLEYLKENYPDFYFVSSTTKVITDFNLFLKEIERDDFNYVVPDFRLNKDFNQLSKLSLPQKNKVEFLCNECCWINCQTRHQCYENVSRKNLGIEAIDFICSSPDRDLGYRFSNAMKNPSFIGIEEIKNQYLPMGFSNFKIEGRSLGSAVILEFLLYYMTKSEFQLKVREEIYLNSNLDLF